MLGIPIGLTKLFEHDKNNSSHYSLMRLGILIGLSSGYEGVYIRLGSITVASD